MEKKYYYLVEHTTNSANIDFTLVSSKISRDNEPRFHRIDIRLANVLHHLCCLHEEDPETADIRVLTTLFKF